MPQELPGIPRLRAGDVIENSVTGERVVVLIGSEESPDGSIAGHLSCGPAEWRHSSMCIRPSASASA